MKQEDKKKFYKMLMLFTNGTTHDRTRLLHSYPEELVNKAIEKRYIKEIDKDTFGVPIYAITPLGKEVWE